MPPRFEFKVDGLINGVPFTGKPDCRFILDFKQGLIDCILDWKVHGYCSKSAASPSKGYMLCRDGYRAAKQSKSHGTQHTNYMDYNHRGLTINVGFMEYCNDEYADQLCLYGWLLGEKPGDENVVGMIEEIVAKPVPPAKEGDPKPPPLLRVANHRARIKADHQQKLLDRVACCWEAVTIGTHLHGNDARGKCRPLPSPGRHGRGPRHRRRPLRRLVHRSNPSQQVVRSPC